MGIKSLLAKPFASYIHKKTQKWALSPAKTQEKIMQYLISKAKNTAFGKDHHFSSITNYDEFKKHIPIRDYEALKPYIERVVKGEKDILWPELPLYFAKTSGTTSGVKYIPISKDSISYHINSARDALLSYVYHSQKADFLDKKMIFLSGSPEMEKKNGVFVGRLSGIVNHHVPFYLRKNQLPSYQTNVIEDWETKVDTIIDETLHQDMSLISGIPPWVQMYFDKIQSKTDQKIKDVFPNFQVFVYGGVNFEPYRAKLYESIGAKIDSVETYPASEGFIAYQDNYKEEGLLLLLNHGIFYEFIPTDEYFNENPTRLSIDQVQLHQNYALIMHTNAGLWGYSIGDTVKFISKNPYKLVVTGRIKHFISAFGEHVIGEEVENAMKKTCLQFPETEIVEFTVAPSINPEKGKSKHVWYIEFNQEPKNFEEFTNSLDRELCKLNTYYNDLITGNILNNLEVISLHKGAFITYMKSIGKLGGQNKVPRLSNDRNIADELEKLRK